MENITNAIKNKIKQTITHNLRHKITDEILFYDTALNNSFTKCNSFFYAFVDGLIFDPDFRFYAFKEIKKSQIDLEKYRQSISRYKKMEDPDIHFLTEGYLRCIEKMKGGFDQINEYCSSPKALSNSQRRKKLCNNICLYWKEWEQILPLVNKITAESMNDFLGICVDSEFKKFFSEIITYGYPVSESDTQCCGIILDLFAEKTAIDSNFNINTLNAIHKHQENIEVYMNVISKYKDSGNENIRNIVHISLNNYRYIQKFYDYFAYSLSKYKLNIDELDRELQGLVEATNKSNAFTIISRALKSEVKMLFEINPELKNLEKSQNFMALEKAS